MGGSNSRIKLRPPCGRLPAETPRIEIAIDRKPASVYQRVCADSEQTNIQFYTFGKLPNRPEAAFSVGVVCRKGKKEDRYNQDDFAVLSTGNTRVLAVFDGHGAKGEPVASFVRQSICDNLEKTLSSNKDDLVDSSVIQAFHEAHAACKLHSIVVDNKDKFDCVSSGTTATVAIVGPDRITIGFVGDSRCIIARERKAGTKAFELVYQTMDQTCERKDERRRIKESGGECKRLKGDIPRRVFVKDHDYPGLAMTRSIGNTSGEAAGIIPTPEIFRVRINRDSEQFVVVASDGIWEFLSSESVVRIISSYSKDSVQEAAQAVVKSALNEWEKQSPWAIDDITCIIAWL